MIASAVRALRHPLAILLALAAALSVVASFATAWGLCAAAVGVVTGHVVGELVGRSRLRLIVGLAGILGAALVGGGAAHLIGVTRPVATMLGGPAALNLVIFLGWSAAFFGIVGLLRAIVARAPGWAGLEMAALAGAFAFAFAAHRDGAMARPLWLVDRAWRAGFDPATILVGVGGLFVAGLALVRLAESRRRLTLVSMGMVPLLVAALLLAIDPAAIQRPDEPPVLDRLDADMDAPPGSASAATGEGVNPNDQPGDGVADAADGEAKGGAGDAGEDRGEAAPGGGAPAGGSEGGTTPAGGPEGGAQPGGGEASAAPSAEQPKGGSTPAAPGDEGTGGAATRQGDLDAPSDGGGPAPVAVVTLEDDYEPPSGGFYLRQEVWSTYDGHRLVSATGAEVDRDLLDHFPVAEERVLAPPEADRAVVRGRVSVLVEHRLPFALEAPTTFAPAANPNPARFVRSWRFTSLAQTAGYDTLFAHTAGAPGWTPAEWAHYTRGPTDPRYAELAHRLVEGLPEARRDDPFAQALAVKVWLDANSKYSTAARHAGVDDPTADYLFGDLVGYCVHTAHAAVYLWRALGLPARVGAGYHIDAADRRGPTLLVMSSAGHAWPELYLDGVGWLVLDIAPAENLDPPGQPLDEDLAALLAEMAKEPPPDAPPAPPVDYAAVRRALLRAGAALLAVVLVGLAALHLAAKVWRRLRPRWARPEELPRVAYRVALDRLAEVGVERLEGESRERFARRLAGTYPALAPLTALHLAGRLGRPGGAVAERPELQAARWRAHLVALSAELARAHGLPRRWAGFLDPSSFWRAR